MKSQVRQRLKRIGLLLLLMISGLWSRAGEAPLIRPYTVSFRDSVISFQFDAPDGQAHHFQLEWATSLDPGTSWETLSAASMTVLMNGLYEASAPLPTGDGMSFFRIAVLNPPAVLFINEAMSKNESTVAGDEGGFWDWIEIYNPNDELVDLEGYGLTDDPGRPRRWQFPAVTIQPGAYLLVFASGLDRTQPGQPLHANFALERGGEPLLLTGPDQSVVDQLQLPALEADQSVGRLPDGGESWRVYAKAQTTPGAANAEVSSGPLIPPPVFSVRERFFPTGTVLSLGFDPVMPDHVIRYTRNGAVVTTNSAVYSSPIIVNRTTVLRAATFTADGVSAESVATFFIGADHDLPVISMASQPGHFEFRYGYLYGMGASVLNAAGEVLQNFPFSGSNAWKDREVEVAIEFYEPNRQLGFQQKAGLKIFGGWGSRGYPQKSFAVFARRTYGQGKIEHRLFPDKEITEFESFVLRNSGNDNQSTHQTPPRTPITEFGEAFAYGSYFVNSSFTLMRDAMMQRLLQDLDLDTQGYRPTVLYINGDYWGIYNLREKINEDYVVANHSVAKGQIDLIEGYDSANAGDNVVNQAMRNFVYTRDLSQPATYNEVATRYVEIDNFIDYHLAVIYFQNFDIGNIKSWRPRTPSGRFRWIVFDQDYGFNLWKPEVYIPAMARDYASYDNMLQFCTAGTGTSTSWPNGGGRTLLLRKLLTNTAFKARFIKRCADLLNGPFRPEPVSLTIDEMASGIRQEILRHLQRWSWAELRNLGFDRPHKAEYQPFTQATWEANLQVLHEFGQQRPARLRQDCIQHFGLKQGLASVTVNLNPPGAGRAQLNSWLHSVFPFTGVYFRDYSLTATAIPRSGYRFVNWTSGANTNLQPAWDLPLNAASITMTANFEAIPTDPMPSPAVIVTEIHYHPAGAQDSGDWVELHNRGNQSVNLAGWNLRDDDDDHDFLIPATTLAPGAYVVLCQDREKFQTIHPTVTNCVGVFSFGLGNGGDTIRLFDAVGNVMLALPYGDEAPWPTEADGAGYTLQLVTPNSFSEKPGDWTSSPVLGGTPGRANP